jgi:hypothetical protein
LLIVPTEAAVPFERVRLRFMFSVPILFY